MKSTNALRVYRRLVPARKVKSRIETKKNAPPLQFSSALNERQYGVYTTPYDKNGGVLEARLGKVGENRHRRAGNAKHAQAGINDDVSVFCAKMGMTQN